MSRAKQIGLGLLALALIPLFYFEITFTDRIFARGDVFLYFYPYWEAGAEALMAGRVPWWNPDLFMGAPLVANSQMGFFYPLNWPLWLWLPIPYAFQVSILLHVAIAMINSYLLARFGLRLRGWGSGLTAVTFALSSYLTAQVEHINQLQGLSWMPLILLGAIWLWRGERVRGGIGLMAAGWALQLLAGHTQTAFITGVMVGVLLTGCVVQEWFTAEKKGVSEISSALSVLSVVKVFGYLLLAVLLAVLLAMVQLWPTLELASLSSRQGGLSINEALSFSLNPLILTRALLITGGTPVFTEYVATLPVLVWLLAGWGMWRWKERPFALPAILFVIVGLFLALGSFNPFNWLIFRLPGFDLFRVPARYLVMYTLGMAILAGMGMDKLVYETNKPKRELIRSTVAVLTLFALFVIWGYVAQWFVGWIPDSPESPYTPYKFWQSMLPWLGQLFIWNSIFVDRESFIFRVAHIGMFGLVIATLFFSVVYLPTNNLTTSDAYFDLRPPVTRLQAQKVLSEGDGLGRMLSLSGIQFDVGDQAELDTIYADVLREQAQFDLNVAIKQKEVNAPNLPMVYGLPSVDGFDGGILPLGSYSDLLSVMLPDGTRTVDGRLREYLTAVPDPHWLDLFHAQYLITDKVGDNWFPVGDFSAFFDLKHPINLTDGLSVTVGYVPPFEATGLAVRGQGEIGRVWVDGQPLTPYEVSENVWRVDWETAVPSSITLEPPETGSWQVGGAVLLHDAGQTFQQVVVGQYRLLHSGDVKIYENLDVWPRAYLAEQVTVLAPDSSIDFELAQVQAMRGKQTAVMTKTDDSLVTVNGDGGQVEVVAYEPERVVLRVASEGQNLLVLSDSLYPSWQATVNGEPVPIHRTNVLFRGVVVPDGVHEVVFAYEGDKRPLWVTLFALFCWLLLWVWRPRVTVSE